MSSRRGCGGSPRCGGSASGSAATSAGSTPRTSPRSAPELIRRAAHRLPQPAAGRRAGPQAPTAGGHGGPRPGRGQRRNRRARRPGPGAPTRSQVERGRLLRRALRRRRTSSAPWPRSSPEDAVRAYEPQPGRAAFRASRGWISIVCARPRGARPAHVFLSCSPTTSGTCAARWAPMLFDDPAAAEAGRPVAPAQLEGRTCQGGQETHARRPARPQLPEPARRSRTRNRVRPAVPGAMTRRHARSRIRLLDYH